MKHYSCFLIILFWTGSLCSALQLLCNSLCVPRTKLLGDPCSQCSLYGAQQRNSAVPPDNLGSVTSFSRTSNILNLIRYMYIYISHSPFNVGNGSLVVCLHGCAVACASCATKQTFAQCRIFLEGTLPALIYCLISAREG